MTIVSTLIDNVHCLSLSEYPVQQSIFTDMQISFVSIPGSESYLGERTLYFPKYRHKLVFAYDIVLGVSNDVYAGFLHIHQWRNPERCG